ncbi:hypothetical protein L218DRAFT_983992 [Marasmius fiardii PR-910]|nr:hypothetical protein L218DRAFT_983992 [Marasmius fiardii PR-910]
MNAIIRVSNPNPLKLQGRPSHWVNDVGTAFRNPRKSWRDHDWQDQFYIVFKHSKQCSKRPENMSKLIPVQKPTWSFKAEDNPKLKATWLGHASYLVELPARASVSNSTVGDLPEIDVVLISAPVTK